MIGEILSEWRSHLAERLRNPLLGPFSALWLAWNWRLVVVLFFSEASVEQRIQVIDQKYVTYCDLLLIPLTGALLFSLLVPWLTLVIQNVQDRAIIRRRKGKLDHDTDYLRASVAKAEAQAALNRILAQDEIVRRQQEELDQLKSDLVKERDQAESRVAEMQADFEQKRLEYEAQTDKSNDEAQAKKEELDELKRQLEAEQLRAKSEVERARAQLVRKQEDFDSKLQGVEAEGISLSDSELQKLLIGKPYRLFHNPSIGPERSKKIAFAKNGNIQAGKNNNENTWRLKGTMLELVQADGEVHSRFRYLPDSRIFVHTGDRDTRSAKGQYIIPE
ncbi:MAG: hypothetical protein RJQ08_07245 [Salinisphaeraceae bacterium]